MSRYAELMKVLAKIKDLDKPARKTRSTKRKSKGPRRVVHESVYLYKKVSNFPYHLKAEHDFLLAQDLEEIREKETSKFYNRESTGFYGERKLRLIKENLNWFNEIRRIFTEMADHKLHGHSTEQA